MGTCCVCCTNQKVNKIKPSPKSTPEETKDTETKDEETKLEEKKKIIKIHNEKYDFIPEPIM